VAVNGVRYQNSEGRETLQASIISHNRSSRLRVALISITTFMLGFLRISVAPWFEGTPGVEDSIGIEAC